MVVGALGAVVVSAAVASAHVVVTPSSTAPGTEAEMTFRVPSEEPTASTVKVVVTLPTDHPLAEVEVKPMAGWRIAVVEAKLATPIVDEGTTITTAPHTVSWTATSKASWIAPEQFQDFSISAGPLPASGAVTFAAQQFYSDGTVVNWDQPTVAGQPEPEHPGAELHGDAGVRPNGQPVRVERRRVRERRSGRLDGPLAGRSGLGPRAGGSRPLGRAGLARADVPMTRLGARRAGRGSVLAAIAVLLVVGAQLLSAGPASAHDVLEETNPKDGSTVAVTPSDVTLTFDQVAFAVGSQVLVNGPSGNVASGPVRIVDHVVHQAVQPGAPAGPYTIEWRVTSADGHPVSGKFTFTSQAAAAGTPPAAGATPSATPATASTGASSISWVAPVVALGRRSGASSSSSCCDAAEIGDHRRPDARSDTVEHVRRRLPSRAPYSLGDGESPRNHCRSPLLGEQRAGEGAPR